MPQNRELLGSSDEQNSGEVKVAHTEQEQKTIADHKARLDAARENLHQLRYLAIRYEGMTVDQIRAMPDQDAQDRLGSLDGFDGALSIKRAVEKAGTVEYKLKLTQRDILDDQADLREVELANKEALLRGESYPSGSN